MINFISAGIWGTVLCVSAVTEQDLADAGGLWEEWTSGSGFDLDVVIIGDHQPAVMDPDRALGAIITAKLALKLTVRKGDWDLILDCPYDGQALRASIAVLARTIAAWVENQPD